jgi:cytochrome c biogenesis protein CcmG/thiol:disulfide interchange protein DsbE
MRFRPAFIVPLAVFALMAAVFGVYLWQVGAGGKVVSELPSPLIGKPAPAVALPPIGGEGVGLDSAAMKGRVALVNVFASWCPPCRAEHPVLMRMARDGVAIFGINYKDKPEAARAFLAELGNPYRAVGADRTGRTTIDWGVYGYPETFVLDKAGIIRYRHVGPISPYDLEHRIAPMLKALGG